MSVVASTLLSVLDGVPVYARAALAVVGAVVAAGVAVGAQPHGLARRARGVALGGLVLLGIAALAFGEAAVPRVAVGYLLFALALETLRPLARQAGGSAR